MRRYAVTAALCLAVACGTEPAAPPADDPIGVAPAPGPTASASATCVPGRSGDANFKKPAWDCNDVIRITSGNSTISSAIPGAIAIWHAVYGQNGLPTFVPSGASDFTVTITLDTQQNTGQYWCGTTPNTTSIRLYRSSDPLACGGVTATNPVQVGQLNRLIAHELGHAIGFDQHLSEAGSRPAANHCVAALPSGGGLNGSLCQIEILQVKYYYGMYDTYVPPTTYVARSVEVTGPASARPGESHTFAAFPMWEGAAPGIVRYSWTSTNPAVATTSGTTTATNVVQAVAFGTTTIRARITGADRLVLNPGSGDVPFTVNAGAPPPPTGLNYTALTYNGVTIRWTSGAPDATTTLQYKRSTDATWTTIAGIAAGVTSQPLTGLASGTNYDVQVQHVRSGLSSPFTAPVTFKTAIPPAPTISNFRTTQCRGVVTGGKTYNYFTLAWNASPVQVSGSYQIAMHTTNSSAAAAVILTVGGAAQTGEVGGYLRSTLTMNRYFWVRYIRNGVTTPWVALADNPLATNQCLL